MHLAPLGIVTRTHLAGAAAGAALVHRAPTLASASAASPRIPSGPRFGIPSTPSSRPVAICRSARITAAAVASSAASSTIRGCSFEQPTQIRFDGFGIAANYTYIDSSTDVPIEADADPVDTDGSRYGEMPADGLSKNSYNVAAFYEKGPWQIRLAYNWRSEYLLGIGANGYNGTNDNLAGETVAWKLPVYSDEYGQLDGSIFYSINDNVKIGLEMNNLNNAEQRTIMEQNGGGKRVTSWYVNDTRYAATLRVQF